MAFILSSYLYKINPIFSIILYCYLASFLYFFLNRTNPFLVLVILELQLILVCFFLIYFSFINYNIFGYAFSLFIIAFAGAEASVGISILIVFYRLRGLISVDFPRSLERI